MKASGERCNRAISTRFVGLPCGTAIDDALATTMIPSRSGRTGTPKSSLKASASGTISTTAPSSDTAHVGATQSRHVNAYTAAAIGAGSVAWLERRALAGTYRPPRGGRSSLTAAERRAAAALLGAGLVAWAATLLGIAPWWPFSAAVVVAVALPGARVALVVPWRIAVQVAALVIVIGGLALGVPALPVSPLGLLAIASVLGAAAAITNNLPASVWAGALLAAPTGYAASIGLAIGPLATPQGSVATLIVADLAGDAAPALPLRRFIPIAAAVLLGATLLSLIGL